MFFWNKLYSKYPLILCLLAIVLSWYFLVFYNLDKRFISLWDESRYAINTFEFLKHKNPFLVTAFNVPDYWNTKPPLNMWLQAISVSYFGFNEFGIRFPAALFSLFTALIFVYFSKRYTNTYIIGLIASTIMFSMVHYNGYHITRNGDVDSILIFFTTSYIFLFYDFLHEKQINNKILLLFSMAVIGAFYTKSIAGFIPLASIFIYTLLFKSSYFLYKKPKIYLIGIIIASICISYYFIRNYYDSHYIEKAILSSELKMFNKINKESTFWQTIWHFFYNKLSYYTFILLGISIFQFSNISKNKKLTLYLFIVAIVFVTIHAKSKVKMQWYNVPAIPIISFVCSLIIYELFLYIKTLLGKKKKYISIAFILVITTIVTLKTLVVIKNVYAPKSYITDAPADAPAYFIKKLTFENPEIISYKFVPEKLSSIEYNNVIFYKHSLKPKGINIQIATPQEIIKGDTVLIGKFNTLYPQISNNKKIVKDDKLMCLLIY